MEIHIYLQIAITIGYYLTNRKHGCRKWLIKFGENDLILQFAIDS